jgi:hypothetical protein
VLVDERRQCVEVLLEEVVEATPEPFSDLCFERCGNVALELATAVLAAPGRAPLTNQKAIPEPL